MQGLAITWGMGDSMHSPSGHGKGERRRATAAKLCVCTVKNPSMKYGFRLNLVVSDSIRADASRKKYGFCDMDAQAALSRLCRN
ncbi:hypothetical protein GCM10008021_13590 [Deinococcus wulumuqiensis]|uniref:Uncharacterized protein n=1 Tax=Deinococcus wulumuqiensis TaxID=980427 RepID=A0ABQ2PXF7_9DEIO|nr:hypothetical protein GCM10008021_13590 [Deinococcus wulumuqiensis]